jgi:hypothetical protein
VATKIFSSSRLNLTPPVAWRNLNSFPNSGQINSVTIDTSTNGPSPDFFRLVPVCGVVLHGASALVCTLVKARTFEMRTLMLRRNSLSALLENSKHKTVTPPIAVIGLGLMGTALAERLLEHGCGVFVWNRTREKSEPLLARGAQWAENPFATCQRVILSLYTTEVVMEVLDLMGNGFRPGQIILDTTTGDPAKSTALGKRLADRGVQYLDAPISGSSEQTRRGEATVIVGGDNDAFACVICGR